MAETQDGKPAGVSLTLPDLRGRCASGGGRMWPFGLLKFLWHRRKIDQLPAHRHGHDRGISRRGRMRSSTWKPKAALKRGYKQLEGS